MQINAYDNTNYTEHMKNDLCCSHIIYNMRQTMLLQPEMYQFNQSVANEICVVVVYTKLMLQFKWMNVIHDNVIQDQECCLLYMVNYRKPKIKNMIQVCNKLWKFLVEMKTESFDTIQHANL